MERKLFKKIFGDIAVQHGFKRVFNFLCKESSEVIVSLDLMKSNFGNYYELTIKIFVHGVFGKQYIMNKDLIKDTGDIFRRPPKEYQSILDLDFLMDDEERKQKLEALFINFIVPFTSKALTRKGIEEMSKNNEIFVLPAVKKELGL